MFELLLLPNIEFLSKKEVVVEVSNSPVYRVTVSHLHHCCSRLTLHELNLEEKRKPPADSHTQLAWQLKIFSLLIKVSVIFSSNRIIIQSMKCYKMKN